VRRRLGTYLQVRFQAERPNQPGIKEVLDHFGAFGLPTYVVLKPRDLHQIGRVEKTVASASLSDEPTDSANRISQPK
jgi:thiol:disulfide interchange protein